MTSYQPDVALSGLIEHFGAELKRPLEPVTQVQLRTIIYHLGQARLAHAAIADYRPNDAPSATDTEAIAIQPEDRITVFTDGSCLGNPGLGGYAAIIRARSETVARITGGDPHTTNSRMELRAVIEGLRHLHSRAVIQRITVVTDSKYVSDAYHQRWIDNWQANGWQTARRKPVANSDLWQELIQLTDQLDVEFIWTKGHNNDYWNEQADQLANLSAQNIR